MGHFTAAYKAAPNTGAIIHDLTHNMTAGAVLFESPDGIPEVHRQVLLLPSLEQTLHLTLTSTI